MRQETYVNKRERTTNILVLLITSIPLAVGLVAVGEFDMLAVSCALAGQIQNRLFRLELVSKKALLIHSLIDDVACSKLMLNSCNSSATPLCVVDSVRYFVRGLEVRTEHGIKIEPH
jgi:hypothetical protein